MRRLTPQAFPEHPVLSGPGDLGRLIRAVRTASGLTLEETALAIGIAKQTLQNLETGTGTVSLALTFKVLDALGVRLGWQVPEGLALATPGSKPAQTTTPEARGAA